MKEKMFEIGDRVQCIVDHLDGKKSFPIGSTGTVVQLFHRFVGVEWDEYIGGHTCGERAIKGHGWYVRYNQIELIEDEPEPDITDDDFMALLGMRDGEPCFIKEIVSDVSAPQGEFPREM